MKNKKNKLSLLMIMACLTLISSCDKIDHTCYDALIVNESGIDYVLESEKFPDLNTVLIPSHLDVSNSFSGKRTLSECFNNEVFDKLTQEEFQERIGVLKLYSLSATDDEIHYGGAIDYTSKLSNWTYQLIEDANVRSHSYVLRLE